MVQNSPSTESDTSEAIPATETPSNIARLISTAFSPFFPQRDSDSESTYGEDPDTMDATDPPTAAAAATTTPDSMLTLSMAELQSLLVSLQQPTPLTPAPHLADYGELVTPRLGGINKTGVWTGRGTRKMGLTPYSAYCMRDFKSSASRNHSSMVPILDRCTRGLRDSPELLFSMNHEPNALNFVSSIKALEEAMIHCGMDGVFHITLPDLTTINFLQEPGRVSQAQVHKWAQDLLTDGVHCQPGLVVNGVMDATGDVIDGFVAQFGRLPICPYDLINMEWSAVAILQSCTTALSDELKEAVSEVDRSGPVMLMALLQMIYRPSLSKVTSLKVTLGALCIGDFAGENLTLFCHAASKLIREIKMNCMDGSMTQDLVVITLSSLQSSGSEKIRRVASDAIIDNDVNGFASGIGNQKQDILDLLRKLDDLYRVLLNVNAYEPARGRTTLTANQATSVATPALLQDRSASASTSSSATPTCWDCGLTGHFRGSPDCKGATAPTPTQSSSGRPPKHGLSGPHFTKVIEACKAAKALLPPRGARKETEHNAYVDGKLVGQYCDFCDRFTQGATMHSTKTHCNGLRSPRPAPVPSQAQPPTVVNPVTSAPVTASLANLSIAASTADLTSVPTIDSHLLLHRHETNYDFGPTPTHTSHLARFADTLHSNSEGDLYSLYLNE